MADERAARAAGMHSGTGGLFLDSAAKYSGIVGDSMKRHPKVPSVHHVPPFVRTGDCKDVQVLHRTGSFSSSHHGGDQWNRSSSGFQRIAVPGYGGHVTGKVAENVHGGTFRSENHLATQSLPMRSMRRTWSEPVSISYNDSALGTGRGLDVPSRIPGYSGTIPGKQSESVHGMRFAQANETAQSLRNSNPHISCDGWLKRGCWPVDRMSTYKWNNRFTHSVGQAIFSDAQEAEASEYNYRMGHTFGLRPPKPNPHEPGDRYVHNKNKKQPKAARVNPSDVPAAGASSYHPMLDGKRWEVHALVSGRV